MNAFEFRKSRVRAAILIACAGTILSGCGHLGAMSRVDPLSVAVYPGGESSRDTPNAVAGGCSTVRGVGSYSRGAIDLDCFVFPENRPQHAASQAAAAEAAFAEAAAAPSADGSSSRVRPARASIPGQLAYARAVESKRERNRLTALLLKHSDDICVEEMGRLTANEATLNTSLSILATGATTAANIVTGELAQQILTGVGTLSGASRSHFNSHVYRNTFAHAISRAITIERLRLRGLLEARYTTNEVDFTVDEAIRAANEYHGACSFYKGLELVLASVEGDQRSRDALLRQTQIDAIDQEIRRQQEAMERVSGDDKKPYRDAIAALNVRRSAILLAGIPAPPRDRETPITPPVPAPVSPTGATEEDEDGDTG